MKSNRLFSYLNNKAGSLVLEGQGQHVSNLMWSCAKQRYKGAREFFNVVDENNRVIVEEQSTRTISQAAWACGILKYEAPEVRSQEKLTPKPPLSKFNSIALILNSLASLVASLVAAGSADRRLCAALGCELQPAGTFDSPLWSVHSPEV